MKILKIEPVYVDEIPSEIMEGILYISKKYETAIHLCACGCGKKTVTPLGMTAGIAGWSLIHNQNGVIIRPSIGNFTGEKPYHAHYFITNNEIEWI